MRSQRLETLGTHRSAKAASKFGRCFLVGRNGLEGSLLGLCPRQGRLQLGVGQVSSPPQAAMLPALPGFEDTGARWPLLGVLGRWPHMPGRQPDLPPELQPLCPRSRIQGPTSEAVGGLNSGPVWSTAHPPQGPYVRPSSGQDNSEVNLTEHNRGRQAPRPPSRTGRHDPSLCGTAGGPADERPGRQRAAASHGIKMGVLGQMKLSGRGLLPHSS